MNRIILIVVAFLLVCVVPSALSAEESLGAQIQRAEYLATVGAYEESADIFQSVIEQYPRQPNLLNAYAWMICSSQDSSFRSRYIDRSIAAAREALMVTPKNPGILDTLAEALAHKQEYAKAIEAIKEGIRVTPMDVYLKQQYKRFAFMQLDHAIRNNHSNALIGNATEEYGVAVYLDVPQKEEQSQSVMRLQKADDLLKGALTLNTNLSRAFYYLGKTAFDRKQFAEAESFFRKAIAHQVKLSKSHYMLGQTLYKRKAPGAESVAEIIKAREIDPLYKMITFTIAEMYVAMKEYDLALVELNRYVKEIKDSTNIYQQLRPQWYREPVYILMAQCYVAKGEDQKAIDLYVNTLIERGANPVAETELMALLQKGKKGAFNMREIIAKQKGIQTNHFTDITEAIGMGSAKSTDPWGRCDMVDFDGDGNVDIVLSGPRLWHNNGNGSFSDVTEKLGFGDRIGHTVWADLNNDGRLDCFMPNAETIDKGDCVYFQNSDGTFTRSTKANVADSYPSQAAVLGDFDRDGLVDVYVANHQQGGRGKGTPDKLWHNNGDGTFTDITKQSGLEGMNFCGYGANCADFDNDGDLDIYVSNYRLQQNYLWQNDGKGNFKDVSLALGVKGVKSLPSAYYGHTIGSAWGDIDNDGDLDLFAANLAHPRFIEFSDKSFLYINQGGPDFKFQDNREASGIQFEETHSDSSWADYDNDGDLDLYITSIYVNHKSFLYRNNGDGTFTDVTWLSGTRVDHGWGHAWGDIDNDGDLDLIVMGNKEANVFRNDGNANHWLHVRLKASHCNTSAIGARVTATIKGSQMSQMREVEGGRGTGSQDSLELEFGFGQATGTVRVNVRWPCGKEDVVECELDQQITLNEK